MIALGIGLETFRAVTRRLIVKEWAQTHGFVPEEIRYRFEPFGWNWLVYYDIAIREPSGRRVEGRASSTGFIRRRVVVDW
jgi:hypothetical protein